MNHIKNESRLSLPQPIEDFFKNNENVSQQALDEACVLAMSILRQHKNPSEFKKNLWIHIKQFPMEKLVETGKIIGHNDSLKLFYRLTQHAVNEKNEKILRSLNKIQQYHTDKTPIDNLEKVCHLVAIAILHFPYFKDSGVKEMLLKLTSLQWSDNSQKELESLQKIFSFFKTKIIENRDVNWQTCYANEAKEANTIPNDDLIDEEWERVEDRSLYEEWESIEEEIENTTLANEKEETTTSNNPIKEQQLTIITTFLQAIVDHYLPVCSAGITNTLMEVFEDSSKRQALKILFKKAFKDKSKGEMYNKVLLEMFPLVIDNHLSTALTLIKNVLQDMLTQDLFKNWLVKTLPQFFFQEPKIVSDYHKTMIIGALIGADSFFQDINLGMKNATSVFKEIDYSTLVPNSEASKNLVQFMNEKLARRKWTHFDVDNPKRSLCYEFNEFLNFFRKNSCDEFIFYFVATILAELVYISSHTGTINVIASRIIQNGISFNVPKNEETVKIPEEDKEFSSKLGKQFSSLANRIVTFSSSGAVGGFLLKQAANLILYLFNEKIGSMTQGGLNSALMSECTIRPVVLLRQILFKEESQKLIPIMKDCLQKSEKEMEEYKKIIKKAIEEDFLFKLIGKFVNLPELTLKTLCKNLTNNLFILFQNEEIMMMLVHYILQGIKVSQREKKI